MYNSKLANNDILSAMGLQDGNTDKLEQPPIRRIHPTKNANIDFSKGMPPVATKLWWQCEKGHEWYTSANLQQRRNNCPVCSNKQILVGYNDLATTRPDFAAQWHPTKNQLKPTEVTEKSGKDIWWQCDKGHEWESKPNVRSRRSEATCPICSGRLLIPGVNDFATFHPEIAAQWHPTKNEEKKPNAYRAGSSEKIWWEGQCGHEWERTIQNMVANPSCPNCDGAKVNLGVNDLTTTHPDLAKEWHPTKNETNTPQGYKAGNGYSAWWLCDLGHEWRASIYSRASGHGCPVCGGKKVEIGFNDLATTHPELAVEWHPTLNEALKPNQVSRGSNKRIWWQCSKGHEWLATVGDRSGDRKQGCRKCVQPISKAEKEIYDHIVSLGLEALQSDRKILQGKEVDIYIPAKKVAIEFNGIYWHTETMGKSRTYHYDKWLAAKNAGIQLIQIWEDDWEMDKEKVLRGIKHKLGMSNQPKVAGRKTKAMQISYHEAKMFLEDNHIQGSAVGSYYLALKENQETVAVLVLKKEGTNDLNIIRYATSKQVIGGFTKLLSHAEKTYTPNQFITFSDHTISDGGLYENNGFTADKELPPDYMYVANGIRQHKFGYRLKRFRNDPALKWQEGLTEKELAELNGLPRIWDAGKTRWIKKV